MAAKKPSAGVLKARAGRAGRQKESDVRWEWFINNVVSKTQLSMKSRVALATNLLRDRVVKNISRPVTKGVGPKGGKVVTNRSKPGEFPKAETTRLMKDIFADVRKESGIRTLNENQHTVKKILTGPIK
jgi:hypothetical protein